MTRQILIVDDSAEIRASLGEMLEDEGYSTVPAADGRAALECLRAGLRPQVILLDLMMPGMDGAEFRRLQLEDPALREIPVVVITAGRTLDDTLRTEWIVRKPFAVEELLSNIEQALGQVLLSPPAGPRLLDSPPG